MAYAGWRARYLGLPDWVTLLKKDSAQWKYAQKKHDGQTDRVLIATGTAGHLPSMTIESLLGVALSVRGAAVDFLLCDGALPACMMCEINWYSNVKDFCDQGPLDRCQSCYHPAADMLSKAGFSPVGLNSQLPERKRKQAKLLAMTILRQDIAAFAIDGILIGEHAMAGALRFYARGDFGSEAGAENVLRCYFEAALLTYYACNSLFSNRNYDVVVLNHGIYVPQGVIAETAKQLGVRIVTWHPAYRRGCFIFNHGETYHHGLLKEPVVSWDKMLWGYKHKEQIESYLHSRWTGGQDWVQFHSNPEFDVSTIQQETGIDFSLPTIGLLTNVVWDAQLHYKVNAFPSMLDWLIKTIEYFEGRPDLQLLVRIHPAEISGTVPSRQLVMKEVQRAFTRLPKNIFIISPDSRLSTYVAMAECNAVIIYGTKTGVELSATGIPVIVAGEAWVRGKGVTLDAESEEGYFRALDALPMSERLDDVTRERALKYAYHFFFRRMIPLTCVKERKGWPPFDVDIQGLSDLEKGSSKGLDIVCNGILENQPFIYPAEEMVV